MARNSELIRQWEILREIDNARTGIAIARLAEKRQVHPRTIRRDLDALVRAGFPIYDEKTNGTSMWRLNGRPFKGLEQVGLSVTEVAALFLARAVLAAQGVTPMAEELTRAFDKVESALPAGAKQFLTRLPAMIKAKAAGTRRHDARRTREIVNRLTEASLAHRRVDMTYHSASSRRTKTYVVDPLRLTAADGGLYLTAWVDAYDEMRTFAVERIKTLAVRDDHFELRPLPAEPFANSLGVFSGRPELVEIEFDTEVAAYVAARDWHRSQEIRTRDDRSIVMRLTVCNDRPLRAWILGFGGAARVVMPASLAQDIYEEFDAGRERYTPRLPFDALPPLRRSPVRMTLDDDARLPFAIRRA
jgi:predicted DNA-binding transcriptional regulator YafY